MAAGAWKVVAQYGKYDEAGSIAYVVPSARSKVDAIRQAAAAYPVMGTPVKDARGDYRSEMDQDNPHTFYREVLWSASQVKETGVIVISGYQS